MYCHVYYICDYRQVFGCVNGFIDHLYTRLVSASNYNTIADLHILQISRAYAKSFPSVFTSRFLITDHNNGDLSASVVTPLSAC
jgi:hypothetical protein